MTPEASASARTPGYGARLQRGFSLLELMIVVAIGLIIVAFAVPQFTEALRNYRLAGDVRNIKGEILLAKMRAAARFTRARVRFDFDARTYQTDWWNKDTDTWDLVDIGAPQVLSTEVNYGTGSMTDPPPDPDTQDALAQSPVCMEGAADDPGGGNPIANTSCIVFNSRGFPVDDDGNVTKDHAIYITNGNGVEGAAVSITGIARIWRGDASATDYWVRR
jgi:prepilin-type N-terminal cleavage/methylation domain-containing protein